MSEDGEKDQDKQQRPVTAAARRERRASARPATGKDSDDAAKRPVPKGKSSAAKTSDKAGKPAGKERPTPKRDSKDTKQASLFKRVMRFLREVVAELRKVVWPTRKQMVTYTSVVLVFLVFMVALVFGLDFVFQEAISVVFGD